MDSRRERPPRRLVLVSWDGTIGGAEVLTVELARSMRRLGVEVEVVLLSSGGPLTDRLAAADVPFRILGFKRGRDVLFHPRRYAVAIKAGGTDGVVLPECGFVGVALRLGGYRGAILAVEHGIALQRGASKKKALVAYLNKFAGAWADDVEVAVSDFTLDTMRAGPHAHHICRIHNGVDPARFADASRARAAESRFVVGFAGRLIPGKGAEDAISALAQARSQAPIKLLIAGDGPQRPRLEAMARRLGVGEDVEFLGLLSDVRDLWRQCDLALVLSSTFIESFGMVALEAMACGKPVIGTVNGAIPEVIADGVTGTLIGPGDVSELVRVLVEYAEHPEMCSERGDAGRRRASDAFHIDRCAEAYIRRFELLATG
jgi:glycosyltransferase involved in cell wall biosynthesis